MADKVKSGKEVLEDFFNGLDAVENVDKGIADMLIQLYKTNKLSDVNVKNELQKLREENEDKKH